MSSRRSQQSRTPRPTAIDDLSARVEAMAAAARQHAAAVDRDARFPGEAIDAARAHGLLSLMVPRELGGEEAPLSTVLDVCYRLGQACASTAMIFAMHQIMVACVLRHRGVNGWYGDLLRRLSADQLLFASSTTEGRSGGNLRVSEAPVERRGQQITLERRATVISYGADADVIVTTARRAPEAAPTDQVLVAFEKTQYELEPLTSWDTLGMRGTCSAGFTLRATGDPDQVLPDGYDVIHSRTMVPVAHLCWGSVWAGVAAGAVARAQGFLRTAARQSGGELPPGAAHYTRAHASLLSLRSLLALSLQKFERAGQDASALGSLEFQTMIHLTKVEASELAVSAVLSAFRACGLAGYRNDGDFTLGRALRDILSSPIMINNERILASLGSTALMSPIATGLE